jgi:hypothetical protein
MRVPLIVVLALGLSGCDGVSPPATSPPGRWDRHAENPLIVPALTTTTVDFGPADPTVMFDTDDNLWKVWFSSTRLDRVSVESTMTVRYSESADGVQWSTPQIALQPAADLAAWDHTHTKAPTVIKNPDPAAPPNQKFMLWYSGANTNMASTQNRPTTFPYYQIGLAYSADGKSFTRLSTGLNNEPGLVLVANAFLFNGGLPGTYGDGLVADPEVVYRDNAFHMWFSSYAETVTTPVSPLGRTPLALGISHATSADGVTWTVDHPNPLASLAKPGDVIAGYYPSVLFNPTTGQYEMWFSNDTTAENASIPCGLNAVAGFWRAFSSDGVIWVPTYTARSLTYDQRFGFEALGFLPGIDVVLVDGQYHAFYSAWGTEQNPDPSWYRCADQTGGTRPAVVTLNHATYVPP